MHLSNNGRSGFTALEALIALAILTGVTASILSLLSTHRLLQNQSRTRLTNQFQAHSLLERVGRDLPLKIGSSHGLLEDGRAWSISIQPFLEDGNLKKARPNPLYEVQVIVEASGNTKGTELHTILRAVP